MSAIERSAARPATLRMIAFKSSPILVRADAPAKGFRRADIEFEGVEQAGPSFEARVFVNNPAADESTERGLEDGYAGSFHVYGQAPDVRSAPQVQAADPKRPLAPITKYVVATDAVRAALESGDGLTITVVALPYGPAPKGLESSLQFERVGIVFDRQDPSD